MSISQRYVIGVWNYFAFFAAAHRFRCASAMRARPSADKRRFLRRVVGPAGAGITSAPFFPSRFWMSAIAAVTVDSWEVYPTNAASSSDVSSCLAMIRNNNINCQVGMNSVTYYDGAVMLYLTRTGFATTALDGSAGLSSGTI